MTKLRQSAIAAAVGASLACGLSSAVSAAEWSDTSLSYSTGSKFHEPFNTRDISKSVIGLTHISGYKYGTNFIAANLLLSDNKDPSTVGGPTGAQEVYMLYRNTVDLAKTTGKDMKFGVVKDVGITFGFDANTKNDAGYASKKRMLVLGPTLMWDVPGVLNTSLLFLNESNAPLGTPRYTYKSHSMLDIVWGIPLGASPVSFEGFADFIGAKGRDEFGGQTKAETHIDAKLMLDIGAVAGGPKGTFKIGLEYEWWKNKFGNDSSGAAGVGAFAKTPMLRAEYHF